jgi:hypothetical protein
MTTGTKRTDSEGIPVTETTAFLDGQGLLTRGYGGAERNSAPPLVLPFYQQMV